MAGFTFGSIAVAGYTLAVPRLRGLPAVDDVDLGAADTATRGGGA